MGLSEVDRSLQPSAARQTSCRWRYGRHDCPEDNRADLACSFASVVLPLFWKAKLDRVQFSSSAENRSPTANLLPHKSVTTEDLRVLGNFDESDASGWYDNGGNGSGRRRQEGHGLLIAVRSEGDLRCKYSAALSSARCSDAEAEKLRRGGEIKTNLAAVDISLCGDAEMQRFSRTAERCRSAVCEPQHSSLCTGKSDYPKPLACVQRVSEENKVQPYDPSIAEGVEGDIQQSPTVTALRAPAPQQCVHGSTPSAFPGESPRNQIHGAGAPQQQVVRSEDDILHGENFSQSICSLVGQGKSGAISREKQDQGAKTDPSARKVVEESNRVKVEIAHNRMREHMTDMLRFLDRIQAKHARRRTTAAFRLRAAKSSDGPGTLSYVALHCLTGSTGCAATRGESSLAAATTRRVAIGETPEAAPLRRLAGGTAEKVKDGDAAGKRKRNVAEDKVGSRGKSATERVGHTVLPTKAEKNAAREVGNSAYVGGRMKSTAALDNRGVDAALRNGDAAGAEAAAAETRIRAAPPTSSPAPTENVGDTCSGDTENVADAQVSTHAGHTQGTVLADDAKPSRAAAEIPPREETTTTEGVKSNSNVVGREIRGGETALEAGASEKMEASSNREEVPAGTTSEEGGCRDSSPCVCPRPRLISSFEGVAAPVKNRLHLSAAAQPRKKKWIWADDGIDTVETAIVQNDIRRTIIEMSLGGTEKNAEKMEQHKTGKKSAYNKGQEVKGGSTSCCEPHQILCASAVDPLGIFFEKTRSPRRTERHANQKQVEQISDVAVTCTAVERMNFDKGSGRHAWGEAFKDVQQDLEEATAEAARAAKKKVITGTKRREAAPEQQLRTYLAVVHRFIEMDVNAEDGGGAAPLPVTLPNRAAARAKFQIQEGESGAELAQREGYWQGQTKSVKKYDIGGFVEAAPVLPQHRGGLLEERTPEEVDQRVSAAEGKVSEFGGVECKLSRMAGAGKVGKKLDATSLIEPEVFSDGNVDANITEERDLASFEDAPLELVLVQSEGKISAEQKSAVGLQSNENPQEIEESRLAADKARDVNSNIARKPEAESAKATECVRLSAKTEVEEVNGTRRNSSGTRMPDFESRSHSAEEANIPTSGAISSRCKAEAEPEASNAGSGAAPQEKNIFDSNTLHHVVSNGVGLQTASAAGNASVPQHAKISGDSAFLPAPFLPAISGCGLESVEKKDRILEETHRSRKDVKVEGNVEKQKEAFVAKENGLKGQSETCMAQAGDLRRKIEASAEGDDPKQRTRVSTERRSGLEPRAAPPGEGNCQLEGAPTQVNEPQRAQETAHMSWCQDGTETPITRVASRATTVPSSFGTLQLSSQENIFEEDGPQISVLTRRETDIFASPNDFATEASEEVPAVAGPVETTAVPAAQKNPAPENKVDNVVESGTNVNRAGRRGTPAADAETASGLKQVNTSGSTEKTQKSTFETAVASKRVLSSVCGPGRTIGAQNVSGHTISNRSTSAGGAVEGQGRGDSPARRAGTGTAWRAAHDTSPPSEKDTSTDIATPTAVRVCDRCGGEAKMAELWPSNATPVAPFLRRRGRGGAYTTKDLSMLSGGYWYCNKRSYSFRLAPQPLRRRDPAYVASQAAGMRARAIQQNLLLSIQREVRLSRRRVRSMYYWPKSFVHACSSAVLTKATMMAAGSLVAPLCRCSIDSEGCGYCLPDTSLADASSLIQKHLKSAEGSDPNSCGAEAASQHLDCSSHSGEGSHCTCGTSGLSLEQLALMDGCCWCTRAARCPADVPPVKGRSEGKHQQRGGSSARLGGQDGLQEEADPWQEAQDFNERKAQAPFHNQKRESQQGCETRGPSPRVRRGTQQILSGAASSSNRIYPPAFMERYRPPLIALWSLVDAQVVEVAGTFSPSPWKDVYRMHWDRWLGGFALDLYSVAPRDMLLQQERFVGLRVDDRHKNVLSRGWWVCPFYPRAKEEAVLQVAVKFRVDGVWRCEPMLPIHRDEQGRAVNLLVVYQGQLVTSPQTGQTQYFFKGMDLSPLTYNPSRSPAYQADGPVLVQPSAEDVELEEALMFHHRRCWNPPSSRPLMATLDPPKTGTAPFPRAIGADEEAREGNIEDKAKAEAADRAGAGGEDAGEQETKGEAEEQKGPAEDEEGQAEEEQAKAEGRKGTVGSSGGASLQMPQTASCGSPGTWTAKQCEHSELQRQRLVADEGGEATDEAPPADPATQNFKGGAAGLESHVALPSRQEEKEMLTREEDVLGHVCCGDQKGQLADGNRARGTLEQKIGEGHEEGEILQQNQWTVRENRSADPPIVLDEEKGDGEWSKRRESNGGNCVDAIYKKAPEEEREDTRKQFEVEQNRTQREGETFDVSETAATDPPAAPSPSRKQRAAAGTPEQLRTADADAVAVGTATVPLVASKSEPSGGTRQAREKQMEEGRGDSSETKCDDIRNGKQDGETPAGPSPPQEFAAKPRAVASSACEGLLTMSVPGPACSVRREGERIDDRDLREVAVDQRAAVAVLAGAGAIGARPGTEQSAFSVSALREGRAATDVSTPRLNRGFSAYGSTLGVAEEGPTPPAGEGDPATQSAAAGALRRVSTLGNSCWPTHVTRHLQTPDVFHELSSLDVAGRRTAAEGARLKRGLTLQCGSYMIPHPDKTESGGADAFFIATPVPPSSRYSKRFACMDIPLARSSTPPLRSIPPSRQRGIHTQAGKGNLNDRSTSCACTLVSPHSEDDKNGEAFATTRSSVVVSPLSSFSSPSPPSLTKTSSLDSSSTNVGGVSASSSPAEWPPDFSTKRNIGANGDSVARVSAGGDGQPQQPPRQAVCRKAACAYSRDGATAVALRRATGDAAPFSAAARVTNSSSHTVGASVTVSKTSVAPGAFLSDAAAFTETVESSCTFEIGKNLPEDEGSTVQMLLREALEENANSGLAQVLSACPSLNYGSLSAEAAEESQEFGPRYSVSSSFICAGAAVCTPPRWPAGAPVMIAGGYGSSPKGVIIGSGGEMGGAVCVGVADGVGEWDSFGLNPRLFAEELMRGCWEAAHEAWFWETPAVEQRALEVLKRGYKATRSFGSCTALVACLDTRSEKMGIANLGDSGVIILRRQHQPRLIYNKMTCVHRSKEQQHNFNCPYQLSRLPPPSQYQQLADDGKHSLVRVLRSATMLPQDTPEMADVYTVNTLEGDLVLLGTDGLFDNLFDHEICALANAALSPYEAALLNNESLATSADAVAAAVAEAAAHRSRDPLAKTPFMRHARRAQTHFVGGKMDDITVVACWVTRGQLPPDYLTDESERA